MTSKKIINYYTIKSYDYLVNDHFVEAFHSSMFSMEHNNEFYVLICKENCSFLFHVGE